MIPVSKFIVTDWMKLQNEITIINSSFIKLGKVHSTSLKWDFSSSFNISFNTTALIVTEESMCDPVRECFTDEI